MTDTIRDLLISMASHMAYMQGQLEACYELDDFENYYWYRKSVALRQKVSDLLTNEPAVPEGSEPASVDASLALRVQRLEAMRETEKAALLDAFRQINDLKHRIDFQYFKLCRLEDAITAELEGAQ